MITKNNAKSVKSVNTSRVNDVTNRLIDEFNTCFKKQYKPTLKRKELVRMRLNSFSEQQLITAIQKLARSPFHRGENDRHWVADPDYLFRNDENVDKAINLEIHEDRNTATPYDEVLRIRAENERIRNANN